MSRTLLHNKDVYYTLDQLRDLDEAWRKEQMPKFSDLLIPTLLSATCTIIGKAVSEKHYKIVKAVLSGYIALIAYKAQFVSCMQNEQVRHAILLLEANNELGAVRFRISDYLESDYTTITTEVAVTYNINY